MVLCSRCGVENPDDSFFCRKCGAPIMVAQARAPPMPGPPSPPTPGSPSSPADFGQQMGQMGKRMGEAFGQMGQAFGREMEHEGKRFGDWWTGRLGILSPLVLGIIGVIVIVVLMLIAGGISTISDHRAFWQDLENFGFANILLLIGLVFLNSFSTDFHRRYRKQYRWIEPVVMGFGFVGWFWIFGEVLRIAGSDLVHPSLRELGAFIDVMLPVVFILVVILGYMFMFFREMWMRDWRYRPQ